MRMRKVARGLLLWLLLLWLLLLPAPGAADAPLTLEDCVARALATIPQMAAADAALDLADAQRREAAASLWPSVRTDVQYLQEPGYREVITNRGLSAAQLIGDYTVYDGWRRRAARWSSPLRWPFTDWSGPPIRSPRCRRASPN